MASLVHQKCLNHGDREAVARCPSCVSFFCRECVAEHGGRILCASCLAKSAAASTRKALRLESLLLPAGALLGMGLAYAFFLALGSLLIRIPASVHDGSWMDGADSNDGSGDG